MIFIQAVLIVLNVSSHILLESFISIYAHNKFECEIKVLWNLLTLAIQRGLASLPNRVNMECLRGWLLVQTSGLDSCENCNDLNQRSKAFTRELLQRRWVHKRKKTFGKAVAAEEYCIFEFFKIYVFLSEFWF